MTKNTLKIALFMGLMCSSLAIGNAQISMKNVRKNVDILANDRFEGRGVGTKGCQKAAQFIAKKFKKIGLQPKGDNGTWFQAFSFRPSVNPHQLEDPNVPPINSENVIGFLDNGAAHTIVIGAHYDHLGRAELGNSLAPNDKGKIHNGADDNASGTAGVIELANFFVKNGKKEPFNFLFICFSGEEAGLIGSKKFCEKPTIPLESVNYMLNMDMIGRLQDERGLLIQGIGTSPLWTPMLGVVKSNGMKIKTDSAGVGPSDYTSFYLKNLPVIGFFSGQHSDYHKPSDDSDKINFDGMEKILTYIVQIVEGTCTFPKLTFQETKNQASRESKSFKVSMGVIPDYSADVKGMKLDGVTEGKPAAKAGFKQGDVITTMGDRKIENIYDYMDALAAFKKGETVKVTFLRNGEEKTLDITF